MRRGMRANLVKAVLNLWVSSCDTSNSGCAASRECEAVDLNPAPTARLRLPLHRGARGVILMAAILHWRTQRSSVHASAAKKNDDEGDEGRQHSRDSDSGAQERNNLSEVLRRASCEHEEALPTGFGLSIAALEVLASAKQHGYVCYVPHLMGFTCTHTRIQSFVTLLCVMSYSSLFTYIHTHTYTRTHTYIRMCMLNRWGEVHSSAFSEDESKVGRWVRCLLVLDEDNHLHAFLSPESRVSLLVLP